VKHCRHCGSKLYFVVEYKDENSNFYHCNKCHTTWEYLDDNSINKNVVIDVDEYLMDLSNRKVAS